MHARSWNFGAVVGLVAGLVVGVSMAVSDWRLNPSGIFHNEQGTNWTIVAETVFSWFWPVALLALVTTVVIHSLISRIRSS